MNIQEQRGRALALLQKKQGDSNTLAIDYVIDDECRRVLNLPPRPSLASPYEGWMVGNKPDTTEPTKTSYKGIALIKRWEGLRTNAYLCPAGVWTIGYGHTKTAKKGMMISHQKAEELLREDLERFEKAVAKGIKVPINQNQFDALVSLAFNIGVGAFLSSTLRRKLNQRKYGDAARQFHRWVYAGGKKLTGLVRRRNEEYGLFTEE